MLFNSFHFFLFFPIVTFLYFVIPQKYKWIHLLAASCYFYMVFMPVFILILFFTIFIDYFAGIYIEKSVGQKRKLLLSLSLIANIGILGIFKYYNFFIDNLSLIYGYFGSQISLSHISIILPIGLSFHTFQAMSYNLEVYRGHQKAERHLGIYALYVMFYPQLVAGPIERPQNMLHQFREKHSFDYKNLVSGLRLILWGLFKKMVIADRLAEFVNPVYNNPLNFDSITLILATFFFAYQIYCDFSGYSDIALGSARIIGFKLMTNFRRPYSSTSISDFWQRWHISLSTWFKDYLYISMGGNRVLIPRRFFNLFFVFIISGFWHGANWTFIIWGAIHGMYLIAAIMLKPIGTKLKFILRLNHFPRFILFSNIIITFMLTSIAWIFFRANNINDAFYIFSHMLNNLWENIFDIFISNDQIINRIARSKLLYLNSDFFELALCFSLIFFLEISQYSMNYNTRFFEIISKSIALRWMAYIVLSLIIVFFGKFGSDNFIYFQF
jgi:alginate O-acetyltransferase complex protein AlgI